jgi:LmbE family N-acetylglucosaminyl deacetylase
MRKGFIGSRSSPPSSQLSLARVAGNRRCHSRFGGRRYKTAAAISLLGIAFSLCFSQAGSREGVAPAPVAASAAANDVPKPDVQLRQLLIKLKTTARLMHTTAHPDDEDGGMLTYESRGKGADVLLLTLVRGEGGQNKMGSNLLDGLGVLRTLELLAADKYYGVEQRFTRVADFGFSKSPEETFEKWHGHDIALNDMVRVIRTFRPDVLVSRFQGTSKDGHGHHTAAGILTREAFRAAADPARFPDQIKEGLVPWQPKKLYVDNVRPPDEYTLSLDTAEVDPLLGMSYVAYAMQGLKHQLSQGAGSWNVNPGPHLTYYKLVDSVLPMPKAGEHEKDFLDGIDTTLPGLAKRLGPEESKVPYLRPVLLLIEGDIQKATAAVEHGNAEAAGAHLLAGLTTVNGVIGKVQKSLLSRSAKATLLADLNTKKDQLEEAANLALGVELEATANWDAPPAPTPDDVFVAVPGQSFILSVKLERKTSSLLHGAGRNTAAPLANVTVSPDLPPGWHAKILKESGPAESRIAQFEISVPSDAEITRPYWHRENPETDSIYILDQPRYATLPSSGEHTARCMRKPRRLTLILGSWFAACH